MVLKHVGGVGEAVGVGDESFADVGEGVLSVAGAAVEVLGEDAVGGEHAEEALEVVGVGGDGGGGGGEEACEDLGGGEGGVGAGLPDGVRDAEANNGV